MAWYAAYVAALHVVPGPWRQWKRDHAGSAIDPWTWTHLVWGLIAERMGISRRDFSIMGVTNEVVELGVRKARPDLLWGSPETAGNVIVDLAANALGWELGRMTRRR